MALSQSAASELSDAFGAGDGVDLIRESVRLVLQEVIDVEAAEVISAGPYERTETRTTERNGSRPHLHATQAGDIEVSIPKLRKGSFVPSILQPRRRIDQALYAVVMEAYVAGVSTRAVVVATGITANGDREILGCDIGDSEDETFWRGFLRSLRARGLGGVTLTISDQHAGLVAALTKPFQKASHQRCRVHFARNLLGLVPRSHTDMVAAVFGTIVARPDADAVSQTWDQVRDQVASMFPKIGPLMDDAKTHVLAFTGFPRAHWRKA